jgi:hypothetical protein
VLAVVDLVAGYEVDTLKELLVFFEGGAFLNMVSHYNDNKHAIFVKGHFRIGKNIGDVILDRLMSQQSAYYQDT